MHTWTWSEHEEEIVYSYCVTAAPTLPFGTETVTEPPVTENVFLVQCVFVCLPDTQEIKFKRLAECSTKDNALNPPIIMKTKNIYVEIFFFFLFCPYGDRPDVLTMLMLMYRRCDCERARAFLYNSEIVYSDSFAAWHCGYLLLYSTTHTTHSQINGIEQFQELFTLTTTATKTEKKTKHFDTDEDFMECFECDLYFDFIGRFWIFFFLFV